jgi:hypothetical protein
MINHPNRLRLGKIKEAEGILTLARGDIGCASRAARKHFLGKGGDPVKGVIDLAGQKIDTALVLLDEYRKERTAPEVRK